LYESFGWSPPIFVHLPLLHTLSGRKLSKRNKNENKESFLIKDYQANGILPEALLNYAALFGWSPGKGADPVSIDDMIRQVGVAYGYDNR
jgi:glutamyl-tRNA synthetase